MLKAGETQEKRHVLPAFSVQALIHLLRGSRLGGRLSGRLGRSSGGGRGSSGGGRGSSGSLELLDLSVPLLKLGLEVSNTLLELVDLVLKLLLGLGLLSLRLLLEDGVEVGRVDSGDEARGHGERAIRVGVLPTLPLFSGHGGDARDGIRIKIVLIELALAGNDEADGLDAAGLGLEETSDLASRDVHCALREHAHTTLRRVAAVLADEVEERLVVDDLVETDVTITLTGEVEDAGIRIVEGHDDTRLGIEGLVSEGGGHVARIPDGELTLDGLGETSGDDLVLVGHPAAAETLDTLVALDLADALLLAGIEDTELLITAGRGDEGTVLVPAAALDDIGVATDGEELVTLLDIPQLDGVIAGGGGENVVGAGVEVDSADLSLVATEDLNGLSDVGSETLLRDLSDADVAILRARGDELVVEGRPVKIKHGRLVDAHKRDVAELACLIVTEDGEDTTTSGLPEHGKVLGVGSQEVGIPASGGELSVGVALLGLGGLRENVTELRLTDDTARHLLFSYSC